MEIVTTRFGTLSVRDEDQLVFANGLIGLDHCRRWVVLADSQNPSLGWLQSLDQGEIALGIVSPRRFVPDYQLRVDRQALSSLQLQSDRDAQVVAIVSRQPSGLTLNLQAPLVINVELRRGCQVVAKDSLSLQHPLYSGTVPLRQSA